MDMYHSNQIKLHYLIPIEESLDSIFDINFAGRILLVSSSGIPVLYALSRFDEPVTAVDFNPNQIMLLKAQCHAASSLPREDFLDFVITGTLPDYASMPVALADFHEGFENWLEVYKDCLSRRDLTKWYEWLGEKSYRSLQDALAKDMLDIRFGEISTSLAFDEQCKYGFFDLSNVREWKKYKFENHMIAFYNPPDFRYQDFHAWDKRMAEFACQKMKKGGIIREKIFNEFWGKEMPPIGSLDYWNRYFKTVKIKSEEWEINPGQRSNFASYFYQKI